MLALFALMILTPLSQAVTVYYQPTPYPANVTAGVHITDGWVNDYYSSIKTFQDTDQLKIGGWGDRYLSLLKFDDIKGLPSNVTNAYLYLYSLPRGTSAASQVALYRATSFWDKTVHWGDLSKNNVAEPYYSTPPSTLPTLGGGYSYSPSPGINQFYGMWVTDWYNGWKNGTYPNYGVVVYPNDGTNNQFDYFVSSNSTDDGKRPILRLDFTPPVTVPSFKMPLRGNIRWLVTTETGGYDCVGNPVDIYHTDSTGNYFSVDFSWQNKDVNGNQVYGDPNANPAINIPIIAAAGGKVVTATHTSDNGYYVVINHSGGTTESTGFTTRYIHMKSLSVAQNNDVIQGQLLGYMGSEGLGSTGVHLHFGVRYNGSGLSSSYGQYVVVDGWLMKSFQTECSGGVPIRYYTSSNNSSPQ